MAVKIDSGPQITFFSGRKFNPPGARPRVAAQWPVKNESSLHHGPGCPREYSKASSSRKRKRKKHGEIKSVKIPIVWSRS